MIYISNYSSAWGCPSLFTGSANNATIFLNLHTRVPRLPSILEHCSINSFAPHCSTTSTHTFFNNSILIIQNNINLLNAKCSSIFLVIVVFIHTWSLRRILLDTTHNS